MKLCNSNKVHAKNVKSRAIGIVEKTKDTGSTGQGEGRGEHRAKNKKEQRREVRSRMRRTGIVKIRLEGRNTFTALHSN